MKISKSIFLSMLCLMISSAMHSAEEIENYLKNMPEQRYPRIQDPYERPVREEINFADFKKMEQKAAEENLIKAQIAESYPLIKQERAIQQQYAKNGYASKDFKAYNAQLKKITSEPAYKKQLNAFNKAVAKRMSERTQQTQRRAQLSREERIGGK